MQSPSETGSLDSRSAAQTRALGERLGRLLRGGDVIGLSGPLGAGKTCLVQGIARGLEIDPSVPVTSPTFTLIGEYPGRVPLRHADFYRVENETRLFEAGFDDLLDGHGVLVVEWFERLPDALPAERLEIALDYVASGSLAGRGDPGAPRGEVVAGEASEQRRLRVRAFGTRAERLRDAWLAPVSPEAEPRLAAQRARVPGTGAARLAVWVAVALAAGLWGRVAGSGGDWQVGVGPDGCELRQGGLGPPCDCAHWPAQLRMLLGGAIPLNQATQADLEVLDGVGPALAAAIVRDRAEHGPFAQVEDLARVPGIGARGLVRWGPQLTTARAVCLELPGTAVSAQP